MNKRLVLSVLTVLVFVAPAWALDLDPLSLAIEERLAQIGDPPDPSAAREARHLNLAIEAIALHVAAEPIDGLEPLRRALRRTIRSRTEDAGIGIAFQAALDDLVELATQTCASAEVEQWVQAPRKDRKRAGKRFRRADESRTSALAKIDVKPDRAVKLLIACLEDAWKADGPAPDGRITILQMSDTHGHDDAYGPKGKDLVGRRGGLARVATILGRSRAAAQTLRTYHCGDLFLGSLLHNEFFGVPTLKVLLGLGVDAAVPGNHDFDFGPDVLAGVLDEAFAEGSFPWLGYNIDTSAHPGLAVHIQPTLIDDASGITIGVFGLTVPGEVTSSPAPVVILEDVVTLAYEAAQELRARGADLVICLSHCGLVYDVAFAENVPGIDLILGGHSHDLLAEPLTIRNPGGTDTHITHVGENFDHVGRLRVTVEAGSVRLEDYDLIVVDDDVPAEPSVQAMIDDLKSVIEARHGPVYSEVIARAKRDITARWDPDLPERDTALGNLVADSYRWRTGTEIAIVALGLIRDPLLYEGRIVPADVFRAIGYGYDPDTGLGSKLATVEIAGAELIKGLEVGLAYYGINHDFFLQVAGFEFAFDPTKGVGERIDLATVKIGEARLLDPTRSYTLTVNTGIVALLPLLGVQVENVVVLDDFEYTVLRDHVTALGKVRTRAEGRIREIR